MNEFLKKAPPRYLAVKQSLIDLIREREWKFGQAIPSEPLLARRFGVSIGTIRHAISELGAENLLAREQGRGTFVTSHTRDHMLDVFFHIVDDDGHKQLPETEILDFRHARMDARTATQLGARTGSRAVRVQNLLHLGGKPVILDELWLPADKFPGITEYMFAHRDGTLFGLYQQNFGHTVVRCSESLKAVVADARTCERLQLTGPAAVMHIVRTAYTHKDVPVETRVRMVDTRLLRYLNVVGKRG
jgi:GntR family transcriptional regulator